MSYPDPHNPYASPSAAALGPGKMPAFKPIDKIEYLRMYHYVFENPNWLTNILLTAWSWAIKWCYSGSESTNV